MNRHQGRVVNIPIDSEDENLSDENDEENSEGSDVSYDEEEYLDEEYFSDSNDKEWLPSAQDPLDTSNSNDAEVDSEADAVAARRSRNRNTQNDTHSNVDSDQAGPVTSKTKTKQKYDWVPGEWQYDEQSTAFLGDLSLPNEIKACKTPSQLFEYLFTPDIISHIVTESNRFANQQQKEANITKLDVSQFLGVLIYMSVVPYPTSRHYWKAGMEFEPICKTMTCNRFEEIKKFLHLVDNSTLLPANDPQFDKLQKIRPFFTMIRERLLTVPKEEYLAVDEQIIPTKTRKSSLKQYNPKKPHKWGYKVFILSGVSGFSYDFDLYAGKQSDVIPEKDKNLGTSSNVVIRLTQTVPNHLNHKIFFDNWFTSVQLIVELEKKGILPLGTVKPNRLPGADLPSKKELAKKGRGATTELQTDIEGITVTAISWLDNKVVTLCSTYVGVQPTTIVKRYERKNKRVLEVACPKAVQIYNRHMGGVDTLDSMLGYYRIKIRTKKWYMRVFFHMVDLVCVNAWLLWRRMNPDTYIPLLDFKLLVAEVLTQKNSQVYTPTTRGRPAHQNAEEARSHKKCRKRLIDVPSREVAEDGYHHFPDWTNERQVCKNTGCRGKSFIWCLKCKTHLCLNKTRNCFLEYHVS